MQGVGIGGTSQDDFSKANKVNIAGLTWYNVPLTVKHVGKPNADVVIGYNLFDGKIIEIDYDNKILIIHRSLPLKTKTYHRYDLKFKGGLSYINLLLHDGEKNVVGLFDFDTGSSETMFINHNFALQNNLYTTMEKVGSDNLSGGGSNKVAVSKTVLPSLMFAGHTFKNIHVTMEDASSTNGPPFNIIGNDILKRFNAIIDYKNDVVYLTTNSLINTNYLHERINIVIWLATAFLLLIITAVIIIIRKRRMNTKTF